MGLLIYNPHFLILHFDEYWAYGFVQLRDLDAERKDSRTVVAIILGGGAGTRLFPLTKRRAKPAVRHVE